MKPFEARIVEFNKMYKLPASPSAAPVSEL